MNVISGIDSSCNDKSKNKEKYNRGIESEIAYWFWEITWHRLKSSEGQVYMGWKVLSSIWVHKWNLFSFSQTEFSFVSPFRQGKREIHMHVSLISLFQVENERGREERERGRDTLHICYAINNAISTLWCASLSCHLHSLGCKAPADWEYIIKNWAKSWEQAAQWQHQHMTGTWTRHSTQTHSHTHAYTGEALTHACDGKLTVINNCYTCQLLCWCVRVCVAVCVPAASTVAGSLN